MRKREACSVPSRRSWPTSRKSETHATPPLPLAVGFGSRGYRRRVKNPRKSQIAPRHAFLDCQVHHSIPTQSAGFPRPPAQSSALLGAQSGVRPEMQMRTQTRAGPIHGIEHALPKSKPANFPSTATSCIQYIQHRATSSGHGRPQPPEKLFIRNSGKKFYPHSIMKWHFPHALS